MIQTSGGYQSGYPPNYFQQQYQQPFNGGYQQQGYTGYYGNQVNYNYYNPIYQQQLIQQQREAEERQRRAIIDQNKMMSKIAHAYSGSTISDEALSKLYDPVATKTKEQVAEDYEFDKIANINQRAVVVDRDPQLIQRFNETSKYHDSVVDPNCGMIEYFSKAGTLYVNALMREEKHRQRDLSQTYDSNAYHKALQRQAPYAGMFNSNNIDDNVITLPENLRQHAQGSYEERRQRFIASIMGGGK
jgi:hypothetical protein